MITLLIPTMALFVHFFPLVLILKINALFYCLCTFQEAAIHWWERDRISNYIYLVSVKSFCDFTFHFSLLILTVSNLSTNLDSYASKLCPTLAHFPHLHCHPPGPSQCTVTTASSLAPQSPHCSFTPTSYLWHPNKSSHSPSISSPYFSSLVALMMPQITFICLLVYLSPFPITKGKGPTCLLLHHQCPGLPGTL